MAEGAKAKELLSRGTKEFFILFSTEELEKMASSMDKPIKKINEVDWSKIKEAEISEGDRFDFPV